MDLFNMENFVENTSDLEIKVKWKKCFEVVKRLIEKNYEKGIEKEKYNFFCINIADSTISACGCINLVSNIMRDPDKTAEYLSTSEFGKKIKLENINCFSFERFDIAFIWLGFAGESKVGMKLKSPFLESEKVDFSEYKYIFDLFYQGKVKYYEESQTVVFDLSFFK